MDDPVRTPTEYLESRLRERRANPRRAYPPLSTPLAKDHDIFAFDFDHPNRTVNSSPLSHANSRATSNSRGAQSSRTTASSNPRDLGARQAEQQIDKLVKENFDLKLELHHRRHKHNELGKRLQALEHVEKELDSLQQTNERLRADNADLHQINRDATAVIDHQEDAIDEAVVKIIELEDSIRRLQQQSWSPASVPTIPTPATPAQTITRCGHHSHAAAMSQVYEAHPAPVPSSLVDMTDTINAYGHQNNSLSLPVPSFLRTREPSTSALRSIYMEGDTLIREIPSHASLVTSPSRHDANSLDGSPKSPQFSVLSESDFKSIYGRDTPKPRPIATVQDDSLSSPELAPRFGKRHQFERTNRWVSNGTPTSTSYEPRSSSHEFVDGPHDRTKASGAQQSSTRNQTPITIHSPLARAPPSSTPRAKDHHSRSKADFLAPLFDSSHLPPTPDTLPVGQLSHSPSSVIRERSSRDCLANQDSMTHFDRIMRLQKEAEMLARERVLPQEYGEIDDFTKLSNLAQNFGTSLFRHESYEPLTDLTDLGPGDGFMTHASQTLCSDSLELDTEKEQGAQVLPSSPSMPRQVPARVSKLPRSPSPLSEQQRIGKELMRSKTAIPGSRNNLQRPTSAQLSPPQRAAAVSASVAPRPTSLRFALPSRPVSWHKASVAEIEEPGVSTVPPTPANVIPYVAPPSLHSTPSTHQRAPSIRERMLKFAHRNSLSVAASSTQQQTQGAPTSTPETSRRRFFARRTPSSAPKQLPSRPSACVNDADGPTSVPSDESIRPSHMSAIMTAANAAAPFLSFDINSRAKSIPLAGSATQASDQEVGLDAPRPPPHLNGALSNPARSPYARDMTGRRPRGLSASQWVESASGDSAPAKQRRGSGASRNDNRSSILTLSDGTMAGWRPRSKDGWGTQY